MLRRLPKPGLRVVLFATFTLALVFILGALHFSISWLVSNYLESRLVEHGHAKARELASVLIRPGADSLDVQADTLAMQAIVGVSDVDKDFTYAAIVSSDRSILLEGGVRPERLNDLIGQLFRPESPSSLTLPNGDRLLSESAQGPRCGAGGCRIIVAVDFAPLRDILSELTLLLAAAFVIGLAVVVGLIYIVTHKLILRPLDRMMAVARRMAEGDLTSRVSVEATGGGGELGQLAEALDGIGQSLRKTLGQVRGVSEVVSGVIEQLSRAGTTVSSGASTIQGRVEETSSSMEQMLASLRGIAENVEVLYQSAEESSSSIMEMAATNDEVAENVQAMAASVEETTSAIEEMTFSIKEVAKNIDELRDSTQETSSSISQMDSSIGQVEANANETARLSEQVSEDAKTGVDALRKTMQGMDRIKESSLGASGVIDSLGRRISEIGNILNVIDDVAEQTNLLALNAAIIAAQSGEHGKGFAVVADEIKDLAERTGASTKEIADLISRVQEESRNAVQVMNQGVRNVEEGVQLGREAEGTLRKINDSAQKSTQMVKAIARATVEQARGSKQVTQAIHRISETVQMISKASNEQAKGGEQIMNSAERMKAITAHVQRSSQEQAHGSKQITRSIENINEMVTHLNRAQKEQTKGSEQVLKAVEAIKGVSEHQTRSVKGLEEAIESLQRQSEVLRAEIRRFKV
ncbi:MAG TPA: methyl-accepting chemotaxis protein [Archangium sp.]|nr:methyl-accepting chemotaxis protein [Archangium sp.]HEX5750535.1 methyl-accepting chemotaxis protein [Archangium sp.]